MQDLILDKLIGKTLTGFDDSDLLELVFTDDSRLICYHDQECCESVYFVDNRNNNLGTIKNFYLEENSDLDEKELKELKETYKDFDFIPYHGCFYTITELKLIFESGKTNSFLFLGESNGYYSEYISFCWK